MMFFLMDDPQVESFLLVGELYCSGGRKKIPCRSQHHGESYFMKLPQIGGLGMSIDIGQIGDVSGMAENRAAVGTESAGRGKTPVSHSRCSRHVFSATNIGKNQSPCRGTHFPQGIEDGEYFQKMRISDNIEIIPFGLDAYDKVLGMEDIDYVGTRLHAGIRALSKGHRTIVISIDNRAKNIGKDTGLPTIEREDIEVLLQDKINSEFTTSLHMPINNIKQWKKQF